MCAINGLNVSDKEAIIRMNKVTSHRGPDSTGIFCDEDISLGHNRLSIIDLSEAACQPMKSDDGRYILVFNGEIYNFQEIKQQLSFYNFRTQSDSEVIIAAYIQWGKKCPEKFNGIFAFALWDSKEKELFIARDKHGIKPLYYFYENKSKPLLVFSSEIKSILAYGISPKLRQQSLEHYLRVLYVPEPYTMFEGIMKLPKGSYGILSKNNFSINSYVTQEINHPLGSLSKKEIENEVREKIAEAVQRQIISDRPLGVFLSGGLDSTIVLHHVHKLNKHIKTYSVGFDLDSTEQEEKFNADFDLARRTADFYKTDHHEIKITIEDIKKTLEKAVWHLDEPIANPTIIAQYLLSQFTKDTVSVVLGGDGGDELFGGYDRYRYSYISTYYQKFPKFIRKIFNLYPLLNKFDIKPGIDRFKKYLFQKDKTIAAVAPHFVTNATSDFFEKNYFSDWFKKYPTFEQAFMDIDKQTWLVDESLMRTDKMTMAHGLEARVPFLDNEIVDFSQTIPLNEKVSFNRTKIVLRDAYQGRIPDFIYNQPKRGWFSPGAKWLRNPELLPLIKEILKPEYYEPTRELFDWVGIEKMLHEHINKQKYNSTMLWAIIIFQIWAKRYNVTVSL